MFCSKCGAQNAEGTRFCTSCGAPMENPTATVNTAANNATVTAPIVERNIAICILLSLITCGIYGLYWFYTLTEDVKTVANRPNDMSGGMAILLSLVTCGIYAYIWMYQQGDKLDRAKEARGLPTGSLAILYLILSFVGLGIVSYALMQNELNGFAAA